MDQTLLAFFAAIDAHDWQKMRQTLADTVTLDSSPVGRPARDLTADQLVALSRSVGGGFQNTCHHAGNLHMRQNGDTGEVVCDLVAFHYLPIAPSEPVEERLRTDSFVLFRKMKAYLTRQPEWLITHMITLTEQSVGNAALLSLVQNSAREPLPAKGGGHEAVLAAYLPDVTAWQVHRTNDPDVVMVSYDRASTPGVAILAIEQGGIRAVADFPFPR